MVFASYCTRAIPCKGGFTMDHRARIQRIDIERHAQGLTIRQLADMCQLSASTVSRTLSRKTDPTEYTMHAMEESLGITDSKAEDPAVAALPDDPIVERYINLQDIRIAWLRAFYNRELAEKDRWIHFLIILCLLLVFLLLIFCFIMESPI